jgi:hypothetical protein
MPLSCRGMMSTGNWCDTGDVIKHRLSDMLFLVLAVSGPFYCCLSPDGDCLLVWCFDYNWELA